MNLEAAIGIEEDPIVAGIAADRDFGPEFEADVLDRVA